MKTCHGKEEWWNNQTHYPQKKSFYAPNQFRREDVISSEEKSLVTVHDGNTTQLHLRKIDNGNFYVNTFSPNLMT